MRRWRPVHRRVDGTMPNFSSSESEAPNLRGLDRAYGSRANLSRRDLFLSYRLRDLEDLRCSSSQILHFIAL